MKKSKLFFSSLTVLILIFVVIALLFIGCQTAPNRENFPVEECYYNADCLYRNQKNPDKSACSDLSESCKDALKEKRAYKRVEYCRDPEKRPAGMSENECRLWLNQK